MNAITTHVLDTSLGKPGSNIRVTLEREESDGWRILGSGHTDEDGRLRTLLPAGTLLQQGTYRLSFDTRAYFSSSGRRSFFPMRWTPRARVMVRTAGSPSGMAATAKLIEAMTSSAHG